MTTLDNAKQRPMGSQKKKKIKKRVFKRLTLWFLISILIQAGVLAYATYWLTGTSKAKSVSIIQPNQKIKNRETVNFASAGQVSKYSVSYNAKYIAFVDSEGLKIYNVKDKKIDYNMAKDKEPVYEAKSQNQKEVVYPQGTKFKVTNLKWLPDRNKLIYALEWENYKGGPVNIEILISGYNGSNKMRLMHFTGLTKGTYVKNIALSTMTNLINIQLETPYKTTLLYQVDIMNAVKQLAGSGKELGNITVAPKDGSLYAEIYNRKNNPPKISMIKDLSIFDIFTSDNYYRLLGVDKDGLLYLGQETANNIDSIYTASVKKETKSYIKMEENPATETKAQKIISYTHVTSKDVSPLMNLDNGVSLDNIYILDDGGIIIDQGQVVTLYRDGEKTKSLQVAAGKAEILLYNKYVAVLKEGQEVNKNQIIIYNLDAGK